MIQFTKFSGFPVIKAFMLDRVVDIILYLASLAPQAIWGVMIQFFAFKRGFEGSIGSVETTSAPRPPTFPDSRAEARAS